MVQELVLAGAMDREVAFGAESADEDLLRGLQANQAEGQVRLCWRAFHSSEATMRSSRLPWAGIPSPDYVRRPWTSSISSLRASLLA
jgi:hypothetical protein